MQYLELLKEHWLFVAINLLIFVGVVFMSWAAVRIGYSRSTRQLRAEYQQKERADIDAQAKKTSDAAEQARQIVALIHNDKNRNLPKLLTLHYNLLSHFVANTYLPAVDKYCAMLLPHLAKLPINAKQSHQLAIGKHLQNCTLLYQVLNAPILLHLLAVEPQVEAISQQSNIKKVMEVLAA
jgi:hypothetical protein